jgi:hypothetical protein
MFRYLIQSGRPDPGNGRSKCFLYTEESCFIFVALSGPKETFEAILSLARHEVNMQMGDALTHAVVDSYKKPEDATTVEELIEMYKSQGK